MQRRPAKAMALPTVLGVVALLLTLGLALCTLSTLSLNFARRDYLDTRAALLARSGLNQFLADARALDQALELSPAGTPSGLAEAFPDQEVVPGCRVGFRDNLDYRSTDNSLSEFAQAGWLDRHNRGQLTIPPYTVEVVLHVELEGATRDYRALLRRVWPYAAFVDGGPIVICGKSDGTANSIVRGAVRSQNSAGTLSYSLYGPPRNPNPTSRELALMYELGVDEVTEVPGAVTIGPKVNAANLVNPYQPYEMLRDGPTPAPGLAGDPPAWFRVRVGDAPGSPVTADSRGNVLDGPLDVDEEWRGQTGTGLAHFYVGPGNTVSGNLRYKPKVQNPMGKLKPGPPDGYQTLDGLPQVTSEEGDPVLVLNRELRLSSSENSLGGPASTRYLISGNVSNRFFRYPPGASQAFEPGYRLLESYAGGHIELDGCTLRVQGDLDLWRPFSDDPLAADYPETVLAGSNATLIVDGTLLLAGGRLDSRDRGMVIYARDVVMRAGGEFHGLIVAQTATFLLDGLTSGEQLHLRGGVLCGSSQDERGGLVLRAVDLAHDPKYLKLINEVGDFNLTGWQAL